MAKWKLRKDRLNADEPSSEEPERTEIAQDPDEESHPVFDLSGNAFRTEPPAEPEAPQDEPNFEPRSRAATRLQ